MEAVCFGAEGKERMLWENARLSTEERDPTIERQCGLL